MFDWLRHRSVIAILGLGCCSGCGDTASTTRESPVPTAAPLADANASSETGAVLTAPTEKQFEGIRLTIPAGWEEKPVASEFIQAEYQVSGSAGAARMDRLRLAESFSFNACCNASNSPISLICFFF